jgi:hypothetical protein
MDFYPYGIGDNLMSKNRRSRSNPNILAIRSLIKKRQAIDLKLKNENLHIDKLQKSIELNRKMAGDLVSGNLSFEDTDNYLVEESFNILDVKDRDSSDKTALGKKADSANKKLKSIYKNYKKSHDLRLLIDSVYVCIDELKGIEDSASKSADISTIRKVEEILKNAFFILTNELNNTNESYGSQRTGEVLAWLTKKLETSQNIDSKIPSSITFRELKTYAKRNSDSITKWSDTASWTEKLSGTYPFSNLNNKTLLTTISNLCKQRESIYDLFVHKCENILVSITDATTFTENFNFNLVNEIKNALLFIDEDQSYLKISDTDYSEVVNLQNVFIPRYKNIAKKLKSISNDVLISSPYVESVLKLSLDLIKRIIDSIHAIEWDEKFKSTILQSKNQLLNIYEDFSSLHKVFTQHNIRWTTRIFNYLDSIQLYFSLLDENRKATFKSFIPKFEEFLNDFRYRNNDTSDEQQEIISILKLLNQLKMYFNNPEENSAKLNIQFDFNKFLTTFENSLEQNKNDFIMQCDEAKSSGIIVELPDINNKPRRKLIDLKSDLANTRKTLALLNKFRISGDNSKKSNLDLSSDLDKSYKILLEPEFFNQPTDTLKNYLINLLSETLIPMEKSVDLISLFKDNYLERPHINNEQMQQIELYLNVMKLAYKLYLTIKDKFPSPSPKATEENSPLPVFSLMKRYLHFKEEFSTLKSENADPIKIFNYIENLLSFHRRAKATSDVIKFSLSSAKISEMTTVLAASSNDVKNLKSITNYIHDAEDECNSIDELNLEAKNLLLNSELNDSTEPSKVLSQLKSYLYEFREEQKSKGIMFFQMFDQLGNMDIDNMSEEMPNAASTTLSIISMTSMANEQLVSVLEDYSRYTDDFLKNPLFKNSANQQILLSCKEIILDLNSYVEDQAEKFKDLTRKYFGNKNFFKSQNLENGLPSSLDLIKLLKR